MAEMSQESQDSFTQANAAPAGKPKRGEPIYELGYHLIPDLDEAGVSRAVEALRGLLTGANIISEQFPAKMTLAYVIERSLTGKREKYGEAYFGWVKFSAEPEAIPALSEALRGMHDVLRFLIISTTLEEAAAPRRAVFASDRLEGETIKRPASPEEKAQGPVSEEELEKGIEALVS